MTDKYKELVERLHAMDRDLNALGGWPIFREALVALSSQASEVERMRGALRSIEKWNNGECGCGEQARAALSKDTPCAHEGYSFKVHGRCCPKCGVFLTDWGD